MTGTIWIEGVPFTYSVKNGLATVTHLSKAEEAKAPEEQKVQMIKNLIPVGSLTGSMLREMIIAHVRKVSSAQTIIEEYHTEKKA